MVGKVNEELNAVPENLAVRISTGPRYCSGMLVAPDLNASDEPVSTPLVLTCAHYFRTAPLNSFNIRGRGFRGKLDAVRVINGTDRAIASLRRPARPRRLLGDGSSCYDPGRRTQ